MYRAEVPHYFRDLYDRGDQSVAPRVEYASDLDTNDPRCVVSVIACTGDWTGGWDNTEPAGPDKFITADGTSGRMVDVITRGEPALIVCHWTGIYFHGQETGFKTFQVVVKRLHARFDFVVTSLELLQRNEKFAKEAGSPEARWDLVIVDECHHLSAVSFEQVLRQVKAPE